MNKNGNSIGNNIKRYRLEHEWTQEELAFRVGTSQPRVSDWEAGVKVPRLGSLMRIAHALDVRPSVLIDLE